MKKFQVSIFFMVILSSCSNSEFKKNNSHFDEETRILEIEYNDTSDDYLVPILQHSHIRDEGYGVLLIVKNAIPLKKQDAIIEDFRKRDINAVHIFNINRDSLPYNTQIAIEGARFTWLLYGEEKTPYPICDQLKIPLKKSIDFGGIIVINHATDKNLKKCLID